MFCKVVGNVLRSALEATILDLLQSIGGSIDSAAKARIVPARVADGSRCKSGTVAPL
jgi:hypothetical protein